jgi:hypothetical protein
MAFTHTKKIDTEAFNKTKIRIRNTDYNYAPFNEIVK